jgi:hypothetical protein
MVGSFDPSTDQTLLAAYVLGHRSRSVWLWYDLFWGWEFGDYNVLNLADLGVETGCPAAAEQMTWALGILEQHLGRKVNLRINACIDFFSQIASKSLYSRSQVDTNEVQPIPQSMSSLNEPEWEKLRSGREWENLKASADEFVACNDQLLLSCYELGRVLGQYEVDVWESKTLDLPGHLDQLPSVAPVIESAMRLPSELLDRCELLTAAIAFRRTLKDRGQEVFFETVVKVANVKRFPLVGGLVEAISEEVWLALEEVPKSWSEAVVPALGDQIVRHLQLCRGQQHQGELPHDPSANEHLGMTVHARDSKDTHAEGDATSERQDSHSCLFQCIPDRQTRIVFYSQSGKREEDSFDTVLGFRYVEHLLRHPPGREFPAIELIYAVEPPAVLERGIDLSAEENAQTIRLAKWSKQMAVTMESLPPLKDELSAQIQQYEERESQQDRNGCAELGAQITRALSMLGQMLRNESPRRILLSSFSLENEDDLEPLKSTIAALEARDFLDLNADSKVARARKSVGQAIERALREIEQTMPETGQFFRDSIRPIHSSFRIKYDPGEYKPTWRFEGP